MSSKDREQWGPMIVGVIPRQHPEVVVRASLLAERLGRVIVFAYVGPKSHLTAWNLTVRMTDLSVPPPDVEEDMSANARGIRTSIGTLSAESTATWILRIVGGEPWAGLDRLASGAPGSMAVIGPREPKCGAHLSELLNGARASRLTSH